EMTKTRLILVLLLPLVILAWGCGSKNPNLPAQVSGFVSYKGVALKGGKVIFLSRETNASFSAQIDKDGAYRIEDLPAGEMEVAVDTESVNPERKKKNQPDGQRRMRQFKNYRPPGSPPPPSEAEAKEAYRPIPKKYSNPKTSGLTATLKEGKN